MGCGASRPELHLGPPKAEVALRPEDNLPLSNEEVQLGKKREEENHQEEKQREEFLAPTSFLFIRTEKEKQRQKHVMLSGRFTQDKRILYMSNVEHELQQKGLRTFMVKATAGESFGEQTAHGLARAAVMVAFCSSTYGEKTGVGYETYQELKYVHEHSSECALIPCKMSPLYPPCPPDEAGQNLCKLVFSPSLVYVDGLKEENGEPVYIPSGELANKIYKAIKKSGRLQEVLHEGLDEEFEQDN